MLPNWAKLLYPEMLQALNCYFRILENLTDKEVKPMKVKSYRANSTEINKVPYKIRLVWVLEMNDGTVVTAKTYRTLISSDLLQVKKAFILDLLNERVIRVPFRHLAETMEDWRRNYHNYEWPKIYGPIDTSDN
jgi:hypothetical protein